MAIKMNKQWHSVKEKAIKAAVANFNAKQYPDDYYTGAFEALDEILTSMDQLEDTHEWEGVLYELEKNK